MVNINYHLHVHQKNWTRNLFLGEALQSEAVGASILVLSPWTIVLSASKEKISLLVGKRV